MSQEVQAVQAGQPLSFAAIESVLSGIWTELLGVDKVGPDDNFFELGGNSLMAGEVVTHLRDKASIEMPLRALFETETLQELARFIEESQAS